VLELEGGGGNIPSVVPQQGGAASATARVQELVKIPEAMAETGKEYHGCLIARH